ncbi:RNA-directed DNA polymerase, eukaryota [Tanacetum coccineum]
MVADGRASVSNCLVVIVGVSGAVGGVVVVGVLVVRLCCRVLGREERNECREFVGMKKKEDMAVHLTQADIERFSHGTHSIIAAASLLNKGLGMKSWFNSRLAILHQIQKIDNLESKERAQKAKIKWAVEGDENSGFFHGIINKRRNIQNIRGVMVDGNWIENPNDVKKEFFDHFANRFGKPDKPTASISLDFPNQISHEQSDHMEREVSNEKNKKSVWECGTDKAPGPDGFTFGFFRHFWHLVDRDVCEAVRMDSMLSSILRKGSIIINGKFHRRVSIGRGLKQGDPLSPFLFLLIMESLHISFQRVVDAGMFHGIDVGGLVNLSHMFYADDAVFIGEWSESNITSLIHVLDCFHKVSGLKINMCKSKIMGIEVDNGKVSRAATKFGCLVLKAPFLYLGSYVGGDMNKIQSWKDIIDRIRRRLSRWKMKMLSIGGRLMLIKSRRAGTHQVEELAKVINHVVLTQSPDSWSWTLNNSGGYTVASSRNMIDSRLLPKGDLKTRWIRYFPTSDHLRLEVMTNIPYLTNLKFPDVV